MMVAVIIRLFGNALLNTPSFDRHAAVSTFADLLLPECEVLVMIEFAEFC
jgi:hypothetical protein